MARAILRTVKPGEIVENRFEIELEAGSGGMATIYRALDRSSGSSVALKVLKRRASMEIERFAREAQLLAELRHPGIVRYVAHGTTSSGEQWLAMEWLRGEDLHARLARFGLTIAESVRMIQLVSEALAAAHARGVVHRDLKPSNIYLIDGAINRPMLLDFGVAQLNWRMSSPTQSGAVLGTPGYMAPEQARGERSLDARADVFALGCVLFECLTGQPAFVGEHIMAVLAKVLMAEAPRAKELRDEVPEALDDLVARMLSKDPAGRPPNAVAVIAELAQVQSFGPISHKPAGASIPPPSITEGEQRLVSVLVVAPPRAVGEQELAATITPQEASAPVRKVAAQFGARVESLADGSTVVMSHGTGAATDQAMQAARCALAIRPLVKDSPMVLSTGRSDVKERLPIGEVIDRAAALLRIERKAITPGVVIRIDDVTAGLLDARFDLGGDSKGLLLRGERESFESTRTLLGKATSCVGRERELALLSSLFEECVAEEVARVVLVTADAGMGKSRLRYEFVRRLQDRDKPVEVWIARGDPNRAGSPFGMLAQALRRMVGLLDGTPGDIAQRKLRARVARHVNPPDVARVATFLGEMLGIASTDDDLQLLAARQDASLMGDQLRRAFEDFVVAESRAAPLVLVLEDLHCGDLPTVKIVDAALRRTKDRSFMVLALARPEVHELFPKLWAERGVSYVPLGGLTRKACERLVRQVLGTTVDEAALTKLVERAEGNAFYLEEMIRAVADGRGEVLPETVLAMVQARLETLEPDARRVLRGASVFGPTFWQTGVYTLLGGADRTMRVERWMEELVSREVIVRRGDARFPGEQEYVFQHALVCQAAYATLTEHDRTLAHRLVGEWLERAGETDARVLATHFERGGDRRRAIACYSRAAEQALDGNDFAEVLSHVSRGISLGADGPALGVLLWLRTEAHHWRSELKEVDETGARAMQHLEPGTAPWFMVLGKRATALGRTGQRDGLLALVRTALDLGVATRTPDVIGPYVIAMAHASSQLFFLGHYEVAQEVLDRIDALAPESTPQADVHSGWVHESRATRAMLGGDPLGCLRWMQRAAEGFDRAGDLRNRCIERGYIGYGLTELGRHAEAGEILRATIEDAEQQGLQHTAASARHNLGLALSRVGRLAEAHDVEQLAIDAFVALKDVRMQEGSRRYLAEIELVLGDLDAAETGARIAVDLGGEIASVRAGGLSTLADVMLARGKIEEALKLASEAMAILQKLGTLDDGEAHVRLSHAQALHASGDVEGAKRAIGVAREMLQKRLAHMPDEHDRRIFVEALPAHALIYELSRRWGVPSPQGPP